jgi:hypothetical protein
VKAVTKTPHRNGEPVVGLAVICYLHYKAVIGWRLTCELRVSDHYDVLLVPVAFKLITFASASAASIKPQTLLTVLHTLV